MVRSQPKRLRIKRVNMYVKRTSPLIQAFAKTIKKYMKERKLSRKQVCQKTTIKSHQLHQYIHGQTDANLWVVERLAKAFRVSVSDMLLLPHEP